MIDRDARNRLALALRRLAAGRITNDEFEDQTAEFLSRGDRPGICGCGYDLRVGHDRCPECGQLSDPALRELAHFGWLHYSDTRSYKLRGRDALTREERRTIVRAVVFLKSDCEYTHDCLIYGATIFGVPYVLLGILSVPLIAGYVGGVAVGILAYVLCCVGMWLLWTALRLLRSLRQKLARTRSHDQPDILERGWPFSSMAEVREAVRRPIFLRGAWQS